MFACGDEECSNKISVEGEQVISILNVVIVIGKERDHRLSGLVNVMGYVDVIVCVGCWY